MISEREYIEMELERIKRDIAYLKRCDNSPANEKKLADLEAMHRVLKGRLKKNAAV